MRPSPASSAISTPCARSPRPSPFRANSAAACAARRRSARAFDAGVARVVIGTRAAESLDFVRDMAREFGSERIAVGIDAKNGIVSVKGWTENFHAHRARPRAPRRGRRRGHDHLHRHRHRRHAAGPEFRRDRKDARALGCQLIASGGVSSAARRAAPRADARPLRLHHRQGALRWRGESPRSRRCPLISSRHDTFQHSLFPMKVLFLDCFSGISGDMTVGALVDLGVKPSTLEWELSKLDLGDFHMHFDARAAAEYRGREIRHPRRRDAHPRQDGMKRPRERGTFEHEHMTTSTSTPIRPTNPHEHAHASRALPRARARHEHTHEHEHAITDTSMPIRHEHSHTSSRRSHRADSRAASSTASFLLSSKSTRSRSFSASRSPREKSTDSRRRT